MDKLPFRAKPKIVDLTSDRRLADKVGNERQLFCYLEPDHVLIVAL